MNLTELQNEVYGLTNRPDLIAKTLSAIQSATLKIHHADFFYKDLYETGLEFSGDAYFQELDYRTVIPLYRSFKYLRKYDAIALTAGPFFELVPPELVLDNYGVERSDICYTTGLVIQIKSSTSFQYAIFGCYVNPDITESGYSSWVAIENPYAIVFEAAATVFKTIGKTDEFAAYKVLANEELTAVKLSNIVAKGY
jgi:hypothetical protein